MNRPVNHSINGTMNRSNDRSINRTLNHTEMSIQRLKRWLRQADDSEIQHMLPVLQKDHRKGVQLLLERWHREHEQYCAKQERWQKMTSIERSLYAQDIHRIAGIDEVGRGPLAGPVVAACVILPDTYTNYELNDSKQVSKEAREALAREIEICAIDYAVCAVSVATIDRINIYQATKQAMNECVHQLANPPEYTLIDALEIDLPIPQQKVIKGDARSVSIAAASILAKVWRDRWMEKEARRYPEYGFERHKGYATKEHLQAIEKHGLCPLHRRSFTKRYHDPHWQGVTDDDG
jgi:ribonuclease HII